MSAPAFVFAGYANSGKTTYICGLAAALRAEGLRVAVVKDGHGVAFDRPGSDSDRLFRAGADIVAVCADELSALITPGRMSLTDMLARIDADIVLLEGFKTEPYPQIGLFRAASGQPLTAEPESYLALVTDRRFDTGTPQFPLSDPRPLAKFLLARIRQQREPSLR